MIGMLVKLAIFGFIVYVAFRAYRRFMRMVKGTLFGGSGGAVPLVKAEECPSCRARIRVPAEPGSCPRCGTPLGRSPDGKLLIKVN